MTQDVTSESPGRIALRALDAALAEKPSKDDPRLSAATQCLCVFRDRVIDRLRAGEATPGREQLGRINAVLSVVLGCHFPVGKIPWGELERARGWLADLVAEIEPDSASATLG